MGVKKEAPRSSLLDNPFLRREAGEGWHPNGLSKRLLGALVVREALIDELVDGGQSDEELKRDYQGQAELIESIKNELGITEPPVRHPEDIPGAPE